MEKRFRFGLGSSTNPQQLGVMVQGLILSLGSVIILVAGLFGIQLLPADIQLLAIETAAFATQAGLVVGSLVTMFGLIRKFVVLIGERKA